MWCYLVIAFLDWKIGVFQQTVVRVYCILKLLPIFAKSSILDVGLRSEYVSVYNSLDNKEKC